VATPNPDVGLGPNADFINGARAEGYSDEEIKQYLANKYRLDPANYDTPSGQYDPSAGGGQLSIGPIDTGAHTPQWMDRLLAGTGRGYVHTVKSLGNVIDAVPDSSMKESQKYDAPLMATGTGQLGNMIGEAAITAPIGAGVTMGASRMLPWLADSPIAQGMLQGGVQGFSTAEPGTRALNTAVGTVAGGAIPTLQAAADRLVNGLKRTPAAQTLLDAGVDRLTPGQMNPEGMMNQFEQAGESVPGLKQLVIPSRDAAEAQYHAALIQEGAVPGTKIKPSADLAEMLRQASDSYAPLYDSARGYPASLKIMNASGPDVPLNKAFSSAARLPGTTASVQQKENAWLQSQLQATVNKAKADGGLMSDHLLDLRSTIRDRARTYALKTDSASEEIAAIQKAAQAKVTAALNSQLPPDPLAQLQFADQNYGKYKVVEEAVANAKDNLAGLTPSKISSAIANNMKDAAYAKGQMGNLQKMRDLAKAGAEVFQNVSPPTGARVATLGTGVAALAGAPHVAIPLGVGMTGLTASDTGRAIAQGTTAPQRLAQALAGKFNAAVPQSAQDIAGLLTRSGGSLAAAPYVPAALQGAAAILRPPWTKPKEQEVGPNSSAGPTVQ